MVSEYVRGRSSSRVTLAARMTRLVLVLRRILVRLGSHSRVDHGEHALV